ncbi:MAG: VCBS repeat-containing protein [Candidatus Dojkabacteria bacterium]|nr:VCBS repeat-containing protein [Candidatus Dojkabacteria bacterium]
MNISKPYRVIIKIFVGVILLGSVLFAHERDSYAQESVISDLCNYLPIFSANVEFIDSGKGCSYQITREFIGWDTPLTGPTGNTFDLAAIDYDNDGDTDLIESTVNQTDFFYENNGSADPTTWVRTAAFTDPVSSSYTSDIEILDINDDGWDDVVLARYGSTGNNNLYYLNNQDSPDTWTHVLAFGTGTTYDINFGDINGDNLLDAVVANISNGQNYAYLNNGGSPETWTSDPAFGTGHSYGMAIGDLDGDGLNDVVVGNGGYYSQQNYVYLNNGGTPDTWTLTNLGSALSDHTQNVIVYDYNNDNKNDVIVLNGNNTESWQNYVIESNGNSPNTWTRRSLLGTSSSRDYDIADVTLDGYDDLIIANYGGHQNMLVSFLPTYTISTPFGSGNTSAVLIADMDNDGDLDVIIGNLAETNTYYPAITGHLSSGSISFNVDFQDTGNISHLIITVTDETPPNTNITYSVFHSDCTSPYDNYQQMDDIDGSIVIDNPVLQEDSICLVADLFSTDPSQTPILSQMQFDLIPFNDDEPTDTLVDTGFPMYHIWFVSMFIIAVISGNRIHDTFCNATKITLWR